MSDDNSGNVDDALLLRLQRLIVRARLVQASDRDRLLALIDDLETVRSRLLHECEGIEDQMARASAQTTAIGAYIRSSLTSRRQRRR